MEPLNLLVDQLRDMGAAFIKLLPQMGIALVVIIFTWLIAKGATGIADRLTKKAELRPSLRELIDTLIKIGLWVLGIMISATILIPSMTPASLFAGLGIGAVAIGFAFQDIFENFLAGILIMIREKMRIGDVIECEGISGKVDQITLRETYIRKLSGEITVVPNSILFKNPVEILTDVEERRHEVIAGVSYDTDLDEAASVIRKAVEAVDGIITDKGIDIFACEFNSSSVDFRVRWWAGSKPRDMHETRDAVIRSIKSALDKAGIEIPFPYVTHTFKEAMRIDKSESSA